MALTLPCIFPQDTTISRLNKEIETIKAEISEKNIQLVSMQSKVNSQAVLSGFSLFISLPDTTDLDCIVLNIYTGSQTCNMFY